MDKREVSELNLLLEEFGITSSNNREKIVAWVQDVVNIRKEVVDGLQARLILEHRMHPDDPLAKALDNESLAVSCGTDQPQLTSHPTSSNPSGAFLPNQLGTPQASLTGGGSTPTLLGGSMNTATAAASSGSSGSGSARGLQADLSP
eukprot:Filipodium_phascolosomae@DN5126_c0_g1_i1.p1